MSVSIRDLTQGDVPGLLALQALAYPRDLHDDETDVTALLGASVFAIGAEIDGVLVGALSVVRESDCLRLYSVEVAPQYQRRGIASALIAVARERLRGERVRAWCLPTSLALAARSASPTGRTRTIEGHEAIEVECLWDES